MVSSRHTPSVNHQSVNHNDQQGQVLFSSSVDSSMTYLGPPPGAGQSMNIGGEEGPVPADASSAQGSRPSSKARRFGTLFKRGGKLEPLRLLRQDLGNIRQRYLSDWTVFNQLVLASAVYVFFTNILPGITFASDLYVLTGKSWGTIEVVFSTGLCGIIFALYVSSPLASGIFTHIDGS